MHTHIYTVRTYIHTFIHTYTSIILKLYSLKYTYIYTHIHTYIHTYVHTYIHTFVHTYIKTFTIELFAGDVRAIMRLFNLNRLSLISETALEGRLAGISYQLLLCVNPTSKELSIGSAIHTMAHKCLSFHIPPGMLIVSYMYVCVNVCMSVCMYVCMYV